MARSAMKPQSRLAAGVRLCAQGTYFIYQGRGMGKLQQVDLTASRRRLHENLDSAAYAAYFCELLLAAAPERPQADPAMYRQFIGLLDALIARPQDAELLARIWEAKICAWLGVSPDWRLCVRCGRPLAGPLRYHVQEGGILCRDCLQSTDYNRAFAVPEATAKILHLFERAVFEKLGKMNISVATTRALKQTLFYQLTEFAGLSLKSRDILHHLLDATVDEEGRS
jgi:DNA repair protein RecO (recombination protein O)